MSDQIPQIGDRIQICYTKHTWVGHKGTIVGMEGHADVVYVRLDNAMEVPVGCEDYDFLSSPGEGFAYAWWMFHDGPAEGPLSRWPAHTREWREMQYHNEMVESNA